MISFSDMIHRPLCDIIEHAASATIHAHFEPDSLNDTCGECAAYSEIAAIMASLFIGAKKARVRHIANYVQLVVNPASLQEIETAPQSYNSLIERAEEQFDQVPANQVLEKYVYEYLSERDSYQKKKPSSLFLAGAEFLAGQRIHPGDIVGVSPDGRSNCSWEYFRRNLGSYCILYSVPSLKKHYIVEDFTNSEVKYSRSGKPLVPQDVYYAYLSNPKLTIDQISREGCPKSSSGTMRDMVLHEAPNLAFHSNHIGQATSIDLRHEMMGDLTATRVAASIKTNSSLTAFTISHLSQPTWVGICMLSEAFIVQGLLTTLDLGIHRCNDASVRALVPLLEKDTLENLTLNSVNITNGGTQLLGEGLRNNTSLARFKFILSTGGDPRSRDFSTFLTPVLSALEESNLQSLSVGYSGFDNANVLRIMKDIGSFLKKNSSLRELILTALGRFKSTEIASCLADGLTNHQSLTSLRVGVTTRDPGPDVNNDFAKGLIKVIGALGEGMVSLGLPHNCITDSEMGLLSPHLARFSSLTHLNLSGNNPNDSYLDSLISSLQESEVINSLFLDEIDTNYDKLVQFVESKPSLREVFLGRLCSDRSSLATLLVQHRNQKVTLRVLCSELMRVPKQRIEI